MQRLSWLSIFLMLAVGCAGAQGSRSASSTAVGAASDSPDEVTSLARKQDDQQKRITELEARLALLETEARRQRAVSDNTMPRTETIRIGARNRGHEPAAEPETADGQELSSVEDAPPARGKRERIPSYRLYGAPPSAAAESLADLPEGAPALLVAPLPEDRARALAGDTTSAGPEAVKEEYRAGLRLLREQRYDDALAAFDAFISKHPEQALVSNALYWRGEAHYAKRDYQRAREAFETLLARFAQSDKAADSLLKVGLCLRRLGDEAQAKVYFRRVQEKFPKTQAAQIASREGST